MYTKECYSVIKKNKIMPFAATWMDLEIVILNEVSQTKAETGLTEKRGVRGRLQWG